MLSDIDAKHYIESLLQVANAVILYSENGIRLFSKELENYAVSYSAKSGHLSGHWAVGVYGWYQCHFSKGNIYLFLFHN